MNRLDRFKQLCEDYLGEVPREGVHADSTGLEDAAEYVLDGKELAQFCLITSGGDYTYLYPEAATLDDVAETLGWKCGDLTYGEGPHAVVDLDTGTFYWPQWETLLFKATSNAPTASP
jgi:hypothetical protein